MTKAKGGRSPCCGSASLRYGVRSRGGCVAPAGSPASLAALRRAARILAFRSAAGVAVALFAAAGCSGRGAPASRPGPWAAEPDPDPRRTCIFEQAEELRRGDPSTWSPKRLERAVEMYDRVAEPMAEGSYHPKAADALFAAGSMLAGAGRDLEAAGRLHAAWLIAPERMRPAAEEAVRCYVRSGFADRAERFVMAVEKSASSEAERLFAESLRGAMKRYIREFGPPPRRQDSGDEENAPHGKAQAE
jgi:hypothetical protein